MYFHSRFGLGDHNVILIKVSVMALERVQGMDVIYLGLSWVLEILNLILDEKNSVIQASK